MTGSIYLEGVALIWNHMIETGSSFQRHKAFCRSGGIQERRRPLRLAVALQKKPAGYRGNLH